MSTPPSVRVFGPAIHTFKPCLSVMRAPDSIIGNVQFFFGVVKNGNVEEEEACIESFKNDLCHWLSTTYVMGPVPDAPLYEMTDSAP